MSSRQPLYLLLCACILVSEQLSPLVSANRPLQLIGQQQAGRQEQQSHFWLPLHQKQGTKLKRRSGRRRLTAKQWVLRELDGAVEHGYFYTNITVGNPPQSQELLVDTGSDLTFMACAGCIRCGDHGGTPPWTPQASLTARNISCRNAQCSCDGSCSCERDAPDDKCYFSIAYAEGSKTQGYMVQDMFHLTRNVSIPVLFGCDQYETGAMYSQHVEGLIGMGNTAASLHAQLAANGNVADVFSLCYGWPAGGGLMLGDGPIPDQVRLTYTPILGPGNDKYYGGAYSVDLQGITLGGHNISIQSVQSTIFDSGTTLTYVPAQVHKAILAVLDDQLQGTGVIRTSGVSDQDICFENGPPDPSDLGSVFPSGALHFAGGGVIVMRPERYLVLLGRAGSGLYCLGIYANAPNDVGPDMIIGTVSVRNVMVKYNVERQSIGLGDADCPYIVGETALSTAGAGLGSPPPQALPASRSGNLTGSSGNSSSGSSSSSSGSSSSGSSSSSSSSGSGAFARPLGLPSTPLGPSTVDAYEGSGGGSSSGFAPQAVASAVQAPRINRLAVTSLAAAAAAAAMNVFI